MVTPNPIRRKSTLSILRDIKRGQIETSKTGIHPNAVVNDAIDEIESNETGSGNGTAPGSTTVPWLLKKRRELEQQQGGKTNQDRDSSTHK
jgi:hypothetical protein